VKPLCGAKGALDTLICSEKRMPLRSTASLIALTRVAGFALPPTAEEQEQSVKSQYRRAGGAWKRSRGS